MASTLAVGYGYPVDLAASRWGQSWPLPQLRPWS